jgi:hypothetical protein
MFDYQRGGGDGVNLNRVSGAQFPGEGAKE